MQHPDKNRLSLQNILLPALLLLRRNGLRRERGNRLGPRFFQDSSPVQILRQLRFLTEQGLFQQFQQRSLILIHRIIPPAA